MSSIVPAYLTRTGEERSPRRVNVSPTTPLPVALTYGFSERSPLIDQFGRIRVSSPQTSFNGLNLRGKNLGDIWVEELTGTGASAHRTNEASVRISTAADGDRVVRQSRVYIPYQAGKSDLFLLTAAPNGAEVNVTKRAGRFDDKNGCFVELDTDGIRFGVRSYVTGAAVDTKIDQADWNVDKLDGTGRSGISLDTSGTQIFFVDLEWLGVGTVAFGFVIDGALVYAHLEHHANLGAQVVYMSQATLPMRYEIEQAGAGSGHMDCICSTVIREGGDFEPGVSRSYPRTATTSISSGQAEQVVAIRNGAHGVFSKVTAVSAICTTANGQFTWYLVLNPGFTGGSAASFQALEGCEVEYDITRDGVWDGTGIIVASGDGNTSQGASIPRSVLADSFALGYAVDETPDEMALIVHAHGNLSVRGGLSWLET